MNAEKSVEISPPLTGRHSVPVGVISPVEDGSGILSQENLRISRFVGEDPLSGEEGSEVPEPESTVEDR